MRVSLDRANSGCRCRFEADYNFELEQARGEEAGGEGPMRESSSICRRVDDSTARLNLSEWASLALRRAHERAQIGAGAGSIVIIGEGEERGQNVERAPRAGSGSIQLAVELTKPLDPGTTSVLSTASCLALVRACGRLTS